jgi:hypothetical protein
MRNVTSAKLTRETSSVLEANPIQGPPATPPQGGPDGNGRDPAHDGHGEAGDEHRLARVANDVVGRCDEKERHGEQAHPGDYEFALDAGGSEGGIGRRPDRRFGSAIGIAVGDGGRGHQ